MDDKARRVARFGLLVVFVTFVVLGGWAVVAPLKGAVIAMGMVKVESNRKTIQHQEGGIVKAILVHDGARVEQGERLIVLEDVTVDANLDLLREMLDAELVRHARLDAEHEGRAAFELPAELAGQRDRATVQEALRKETFVFQARRSSLEGQIRLLRDQALEAEREEVALQDALASGAESIRLAKEELELNESLRKKEYIAGTQLITLRRLVAEYQTRYNEYQADVAKTRQRRSELELRILSLQAEFERSAAEDLKESSTRIVELREKIRPSEDASRRQVITAPIAGRVVALQVHTVGAVIGPREPLMDIVPEDAPLIVEAKTHVDAIDQLHVDQEADIRFTTFNSRTTPLVTGRLVYLSADALVDKEGRPYFQLHVRPDPESIRHAGIERLSPGMAAEVFFQTKERTVFEYFVQPILDSVRRAMRER